MSTFYRKIRRFLAETDGPTAVEYAVVASMIGAVCVAGVRSVGGATAQLFSQSATSISDATGGSADSGSNERRGSGQSRSDAGGRGGDGNTRDGGGNESGRGDSLRSGG